MAQSTILLESEIQGIADNYKLKIVNYEPIEQGASNSNYLITTNQGKYVLTVFEIEPILVKNISKVLLLLENYQFPAPRLQKLANGEGLTKFQEKPVMLKPYISGQTLTVLDLDNTNQVGAALARLHEIPVPDYLPNKHAYVVNTYPRIMEQEIDQEYKYWVGQRHNFLIKNMPTSLPIGLIHGDLFYDNVLFENDKFKAILDFEDVGQNYKVFDLGMAAVGLCAEGPILMLDKVRALVNGDQEGRLLEEKEKESLQMFIEYAAIVTSTWRFWKYNMDETDNKNSGKYMQMVKIAKDASAKPKKVFMSSVFV